MSTPTIGTWTPEAASIDREALRQRLAESYPQPDICISPASYLQALRLLGKPEGHRLTVMEFYEACQIEAESLSSD